MGTWYIPATQRGCRAMVLGARVCAIMVLAVFEKREGDKS